MDGVKSLECSPEEPGGVEGVEWWDSHRGNRRDPSPPHVQRQLELPTTCLTGEGTRGRKLPHQ